MKINEVCKRIDEVINFSTMSDAKLKRFIASFDPDERMGQVAGMQLKAARKEARKRGILNEACDANQCVVQMGTQRGFKSGQVDPKLADASDARDDEVYDWEGALSDKDFDTYDRTKMKTYRDTGSKWQAHLAGKKQLNMSAKPRTLMQAVGEASPDLPSSNFKHTEEYSIEFGKEIDFARWIAQQLEIMGVTQEQAERLYKASKEGDYNWVHRFGASPKLKALVGHNIGTAMTSNAVAIHNGMGLHAGILKIRPKQNRPPSRIPDDLQPGGHDTDEYLRSRDERQAQQYRDPDMNWSAFR
tara:strand:+ start:632 stop:1534 length:903 start_codon:yes stop_codon:yes gene_type:complete